MAVTYSPIKSRCSGACPAWKAFGWEDGYRVKPLWWRAVSTVHFTPMSSAGYAQFAGLQALSVNCSMVASVTVSRHATGQ